MPEWLKERTFDFMVWRRAAGVFSGVLVLAAILSLIVRGLNFGIDFTGGTLVEVHFPQPANLTEIRQKLAAADFRDAVVQYFGTPNEVLIRIAPRNREESTAQISEQVLEALAVDLDQMRRVEFVGPQVGKELTEDGGLAVLFALIAILVYVSFRFEWKFALGSVAALIHDVLITLGIFSFFQIEFDLSVLAAILAIIGYSLNDTIVVFDRIRENFRKIRKAAPVEVLNRSINQTMSRTVVTSLTTMLVLISLYFFGGEVINAFALALIVGVVVGTYSSVFVASTVTLALGISKADLMPAEKEGAETDPLP